MSQRRSRFVKAMLITVLFCPAATIAFMPWAHAQVTNPGRAPLEVGGNIGNGGSGGSTDVGSLLPPQPLNPRAWCNNVGALLDEALGFAAIENTDFNRRLSLQRSLQGLVASYQTSVLPMGPATQSLLRRVLAINLILPSSQTASSRHEGMLADTVAYMFMRHMVNVAKHINATFDVTNYLPYYNSHTDALRPTFDFVPFYVSYFTAVQLVVSEFFSPAFDPADSRGSVLNNFARDQWEFAVVLSMMEWMASELENDVFRRSFSCLSRHIRTVSSRIGVYLNGQTRLSAPAMRSYVEGQLQDLRLRMGAMTAERIRDVSDVSCQIIAPHSNR